MPAEDWLILDDADVASVKERYDPTDGYFRTGDIGVLLPGNRLQIIDRASAVVKLSNGMFFSPERVEAAVLGTVHSLVACVVTAVNDGSAIVAVCAMADDAAGWLLSAWICTTFVEVEKCRSHFVQEP